MTRLKLPRFQYTAREPVSGRLPSPAMPMISPRATPPSWLNNSPSISPVMASICPRSPGRRTTAVSSWKNKDEQGLPATVRALGSDHRYIPPKRYTWQSDVETVHRLIEDEFLIWKPSPAFPTSGPKSPPTGITSIWSVPIAARNGKALCKSSKNKPRPLVGAVLNWQPPQPRQTPQCLLA